MATAKSSYSEKLLDPRWQRKRLEALQRYDFRCEVCGDETSTLHVHHKQYIKGREPWEYEVDQLCVMCKGCHSDAHEEEDLLLVVSSYACLVGLNDRNSCASLLAGFIGLPMTNELVTDPSAYVIGELALELHRVNSTDIPGIASWVASNEKDIKKLANILMKTDSNRGFADA